LQARQNKKSYKNLQMFQKYFSNHKIC